MFDFEIQDGVLVWYKGEEDTVEIPREVTRIGVGAFRDSEIVRVLLHDGITRIHRCAFSGCYRLREIVIPDSVCRIDRYAFDHCAALQSVRLPESLDHIRESTFEACTSLESITLPDSVRIIGPAAFRECTSLKSIDMPDETEEIREVAFMDCRTLRLDRLPMHLKRLDSLAFDRCDEIVALRLGDDLEQFGNWSFPHSVSSLYVSNSRIAEYLRILNEQQTELSTQHHCMLVGRSKEWERDNDILRRHSNRIQTTNNE